MLGRQGITLSVPPAAHLVFPARSAGARVVAALFSRCGIGATRQVRRSRLGQFGTRLRQDGGHTIRDQIGGDTAGAFSFGAATDRALWAYAPLTTFYDTADPHQAQERHFEDLGRRPFLVGEESVRQSLAGGQKKSALAVWCPDGSPVLRLLQQGDMLAIPLNGAPSTL
jgi:hypothetical protein